jgi:hypothetical protein
MREVREILEIATADAPPAGSSVDDIVRAGRRRHRRAVVRRVGGAGLLTVAAVSAGALLLTSLEPVGGATGVSPPAPRQTSAPPTAAPAPPFTFTFGGYRVGYFRVLDPDEVTPSYQVTGIIYDGRDAAGAVQTRYAGTLTVFQPGAFDPARFRTGTPIKVRGGEGYQLRQPVSELPGVVNGDDSWNRGPTGSAPGSVATTEVDATAWQYANGAWATIEAESGPAGSTPFTAADQAAVAEQFLLTPDLTRAARAPFRAGYLPAGVTLRSVSGQSMTAENRGMVSFAYGTPDLAAGPLSARRGTHPGASGASLIISLLWVDTPPPDARERTGRCNTGQYWCMGVLPGGEFFAVAEDPSHTRSDEELLKVLDNLQFADVKDATTWTPLV